MHNYKTSLTITFFIVIGSFLSACEKSPTQIVTNTDSNSSAIMIESTSKVAEQNCSTYTYGLDPDFHHIVVTSFNSPESESYEVYLNGGPGDDMVEPGISQLKVKVNISAGLDPRCEGCTSSASVTLSGEDSFGSDAVSVSVSSSGSTDQKSETLVLNFTEQAFNPTVTLSASLSGFVPNSGGPGTSLGDGTGNASISFNNTFEVIGCY